MPAAEDRAAVAVLGLGRMGAALAQAFLAAGHPTTVWNRSPEKAAPLEAQGASIRAGVREAVESAPVVCICLTDYAAVAAALAGAEDAFAGRALVNLTSGTPEQARAMAAWAAEHGIDYLDGAMVAPVTLVGQPFAVSLYSGSRSAFEAAEGALRALGDVSYLGDDAGLGMLFDLGLLGIMWATMTSYLHALALARGAGESPAMVTKALAFVPTLTSMMERWAEMVAAGEYPGTVATLQTHANGLALLVDASRAAGVAPDLPQAIAGLVQRTIADGSAEDAMARMVHTLEGAGAGA